MMGRSQRGRPASESAVSAPTRVDSRKIRRLLFPAFQEGLKPEAIASLDRGLARMAARAFREKAFRGEPGETLVILPPEPGRIQSLTLLGLGPERKATLEAVRRVFGAQARRSAKWPREDISLTLDAPAMRKLAARFGAGPLAKAITIGWSLGGYSFDAYKTDGRNGERKRPVRLHFSGTAPPGSRGSRAPGRVDPGRSIERAVKQGMAVARAVNFARDLSNTPPNDLDPERLADHARKLARAAKLRVQVLRKRDLERLRMGALLAVAQGSSHPPCLIILEYRPPRAARSTLALVGKAITFDAGGLSIKPAKGMEEMKFDMAGGAAVLGSMMAIAELRPPIRVIGLIPAAENVIGGSAMRPGDIIRSAAGKTIEVINTDAEGRLVLADALHHARRYQPDHIIDFATLTGACLVALGSQVSGMVTNDKALGREVFQAGERTGERVWELPLYEEFIEAAKSTVADLRNSMGRNAGAITAAAFLSHFVGRHKWCHVDIAGTAWTEKEGGCFAAGATGVGVRLIVDLVESLARSGEPS